MSAEIDFIGRIDPFYKSLGSNIEIPTVLRRAAEKLPSILQNGG